MRLAACVEYDGSDYCGWQRQNHSPSVQQIIEQALSNIAKEPISVICAGRTDTGVHALGQIIHWDTEAQRTEYSWLLGTNTQLAKDVVLRWVRPVDETFHARFCAHSRSYRYIIYNHRVRPALMRNQVTWQRHVLDAEHMHAAAVTLCGEHDFSSFCSHVKQAKNPQRNIKKITVIRVGKLVYLDITANSFLHHMVRNIAGVLMAIGRGEQPVAWTRELLMLRDRRKGGVTASASGLYLMKVDYDTHWKLPAVADFPILHGV